MTTNLSESFIHILKGSCALHVSVLVQLIFFRTNAYFDKQKDYPYDYMHKENYGLLLLSWNWMPTYLDIEIILQYFSILMMTLFRFTPLINQVSKMKLDE